MYLVDKVMRPQSIEAICEALGCSAINRSSRITLLKIKLDIHFFYFISTVLFTFICSNNNKLITHPCVVGSASTQFFLKTATRSGSKQSLVKILKGGGCCVMFCCFQDRDKARPCILPRSRGAARG